MVIRGSLKITKSLLLPNPNGTLPRKGLIAIADDNGSLGWGDLLVPGLEDVIYPTEGALVLHDNKLYFSIQDNASGSLPIDPLYWTEVGSGTGGGTTLPQNQIDALDASSAPTGANPFATLSDINNLNILGSTNISEILISNASVPNRLWITTTGGFDSYGTPVLAGDGLVSDGSGWKSIGQFRGPIGLQGIQGEEGPAGGGITMQGSDTVAAILAKDATTTGLLWIATDTGVDSYTTPVVAGDGLVADGTAWITVGPIRGPKGDTGDAGPGLPIGGAIGQRIRKAIGGDYITEWFTSKFEYVQGAPSAQWDIAHNLGEVPTVQIIDTNNFIIEAEVEHIDINNVKITFNTAIDGKAYLKI